MCLIYQSSIFQQLEKFEMNYGIIKLLLPPEKANKTIGRPPAIPSRKVLDGILYTLRTGDIILIEEFRLYKRSNALSFRKQNNTC